MTQRYRNDDLISYTLNEVQKQVLIGTLLGDAYLENPGRNPRMRIDRKYADREYLEWQFSVFKELCASGVKTRKRYDARYDKAYKQVSFSTRAVPAFLPYHQVWYPEGIKIVPENIKLTPLTLAVWFADDGCIIREHKDSNRLILQISTDGFGYKGAKLLSEKLEAKFGASFPIYRKKKNKDLWIIKASTAAARAFIACIAPFIDQMGMVRKSAVWNETNLKAPVYSGGHGKYAALAGFVMGRKSFTAKELEESGIYAPKAVRGRINRFMQEGVLQRIETNEPYNVYRYSLTASGKTFFKSYLP